MTPVRWLAVVLLSLLLVAAQDPTPEPLPPLVLPVEECRALNSGPIGVWLDCLTRATVTTTPTPTAVVLE